MSLVLFTASQGLFPPERGRLSIKGAHFYTEDGKLFQWRGYSCFLLFLRYCRGEDITPELHWFRANGFNMLRIFGPLPWTQTPDYRVEHFDFAKLHTFLSLLESYGLRSNWSLCHYQHPELATFVRKWFEVAGQHWSVVAEMVNEPHVGSEKPDPIALTPSQRYGILTAYGLYGKYYDKAEGLDPVLDFATIHIQRDAAWHRKARHAQEWQDKIDKPVISDEPAKITEPGFQYPGGKNNPLTTPQEMCWHGAVCDLWTSGFTLHTEEGKWGRVPRLGMLQHTVAMAVKDNLFRKISAGWQTGEYNHSENHDSPVDDVNDSDGDPVWTYTSLHSTTALSVRCAPIAINAKNDWEIVDSWLGGTLVTLDR